MNFFYVFGSLIALVYICSWCVTDTTERGKREYQRFQNLFKIH